MNAIEHKKCYGTMLPSVLNRTTDDAGKAFRFKITPHGLSAPHRQVIVDLAEWDDCMACEEFESCYRLCTVKLKLETAIGGI